MDENGDPGVGLQESPKYRIKGGMMRGRNYFGLLVILLFGSFTLLASTASAQEMIGTDPTNQWSVKVTANDDTCGQDRSGNTIRCTKFFYDIIKHPVGVFPNQANARIPICEQGSGFYIVTPTDRSVKIRDCDPNSGFVCDDLFADAITWDALKEAPSNQFDFSVAVSPASIEKTTVALVTEFGNILVPTLGPGCCSKTQVTTQINNVIGSNSTGPILTVDSGVCSFEPTSVSYDSGSGPITAVPLPGLAHCNDRAGVVDRTSCVKITKLGPESGLYVLSRLPGCTIGTCPGYAYYGWGNKIYQFNAMVPSDVDIISSCYPSIRNVPWKGSVVVDESYEFVPDGCGNGSIYLWTKTNGRGALIAGPNIPNTPIWLVPYDSAGKLILSQASVVVSGSAEGVVFFNGCQLIGGRWVCR